MAYAGRRIVELQTSLALVHGSSIQPIPVPEDAHGRVPFQHPALLGLDGLTEMAKSTSTDKTRMARLGERYGLDGVLRWKPKRVSHQSFRPLPHIGTWTWVNMVIIGFQSPIFGVTARDSAGFVCDCWGCGFAERRTSCERRCKRKNTESVGTAAGTINLILHMERQVMSRVHHLLIRPSSVSIYIQNSHHALRRSTDIESTLQACRPILNDELLPRRFMFDSSDAAHATHSFEAIQGQFLMEPSISFSAPPYRNCNTDYTLIWQNTSHSFKVDLHCLLGALEEKRS